jgi:hypothetical protein
MEILISDLVNNIKESFDSTKVVSVDTVYEKIEDSNDLKLVVFMNSILYDDINIIYTKLIFIVSEDKYKITKNYFTYLYDINCEYVRLGFEDMEEFKSKLKNVFEKTKFGDNIKILSEFIKSPAVLVNEWLSENDVSDLSVTGFKYEPKIKIMPCKSLFFSFAINLSNEQSVDLEISKYRKTSYIFKFKILDNYETVEQENLNNLVQVVGDTLKNKIK